MPTAEEIAAERMNVSGKLERTAGGIQRGQLRAARVSREDKPRGFFPLLY
jgi:hypothetical protein